MAIVRFNPMNEVLNLQREMDRLVDRFFPTPRADDDARSAVWRPIVDIHEDENAYTIDAELPGMRKEDVKISFQDGVLSIAGERRYEYEEKTPADGGNGDGNGSPVIEGRTSSERKGRSCHRMERFYGRFHRSFTFPQAVDPDAINATFTDGVLRVSVAKAEQAKPRQIAIG